MAPPKLAAISVMWDNPPDAKQGARIIRRVGQDAYVRRVKPGDWVTQLEAARLLGISRMTVNTWVRKGLLKDKKRGGVSMLKFTDVRRLGRERGYLQVAGTWLVN